jgi:hypothetical protein
MKKVSLLALALSGIVGSSFAQSDNHKPDDRQSDDRGSAAKQYVLQIDRQPLLATLRVLSEQTGLQVVGLMARDSEDGQRIVGPLHGAYTAEAALNALLEKSDLVFKRVNDRTIAIVTRHSVDRTETSSQAADSFMKLGGAGNIPSGAGLFRTINPRDHSSP